MTEAREAHSRADWERRKARTEGKGRVTEIREGQRRVDWERGKARTEGQKGKGRKVWQKARAEKGHLGQREGKGIERDRKEILTGVRERQRRTDSERGR